eukprot:GEMP01051141.1.p1 GENE.GEMP01051141.1~~GEMP01051141.1.p1  ORF type:complete len:190 (+),score=38.32 GEMP01051141.1:405-974(+)
MSDTRDCPPKKNIENQRCSRFRWPGRPTGGKRKRKWPPIYELIRAKYQDNLEFLQWMKCFFDKTYGGHDYNPIERRPQDAASLPAWAHASPHLDGPSSLAVENAPRPRSVDKSGAAAPAPKKATAMRNRQQPPAARGAGAAAANSNYTKMQDELNDLRITVEGLENERDYYFGKLREIEILTQTLEIQR